MEWGWGTEAEFQAGCKVGTVIHRLVLCERNKDAHGGEGQKKIQELRDWYSESPWDPLWWCGVAAMPITPPVPAFEE